MKLGPVVSMVLLVLLGMWLVFQPYRQQQKELAQAGDAVTIRSQVGGEKFYVQQRATGDPMFRFVGLGGMDDGWYPVSTYVRVLNERAAAWNARPGWERAVMGFFNISSWVNALWIVVGLGGQAAFFGRMFVQWVVSEKQRQSTVPEMFWWFSLVGGVCLFSYFVWRVDFVGVLGQSTGIVIYARNLRLIKKQKRRDARARAALAEQNS